MQKAGFAVDDGDHPIVPVMLGDANLAQEMSKKLLSKRYICNRIFLSSCT